MTGITMHIEPGVTTRRYRDRVRYHTASDVLRCIDDATKDQLKQHATVDSRLISERLQALDRQWDTDRAIELEASTVGLVGLALGAFVRTSFLAIPAVVGGALLLHAFTGRYPLLPVFRRMGMRTSREIAREKYALKALRGDFRNMDASRPLEASSIE
jgi:hypothetical protein